MPKPERQFFYFRSFLSFRKTHLYFPINNIAARLDEWGFKDIMTFELTVSSKPDRHENDNTPKWARSDILPKPIPALAALQILEKSKEKTSDTV